MDGLVFDRLVRSAATGSTRRRLLFLMAGPFLAGALTSLLSPEGKAERRSRHHRNHARHRHTRHQAAAQPQRKRKKHRRHDCTPETAAQTCAGRCGNVTNNCDISVNCGSCACPSACPVCQVCNATTGRCETNPAFLALVCAAPGQVCQADGRCACNDTSCPAGQLCNGLACICDASSCPTGCCDDAGRCRIADDAACGIGGVACTRCPDCQRCDSAGQCVTDPGQNRATCQVAAGGTGVCCNGSCCAGCCDGNESCGACLAFVTSTTYSGNLGGLGGADVKCQVRAQAGSLPGTYKAWLSDSTHFPATRFRCSAASCSSAGYQRVDGVTIATDWAQLTDGSLDTTINVTELRQSTGGSSVWTHTRPDGTAGGSSNVHCQNWTSENGFPVAGDFGSSGFSNSLWTAQFTFTCDALLNLYCFQQS